MAVTTLYMAHNGVTTLYYIPLSHSDNESGIKKKSVIISGPTKCVIISNPFSIHPDGPISEKKKKKKRKRKKKQQQQQQPKRSLKAKRSNLTRCPRRERDRDWKGQGIASTSMELTNRPDLAPTRDRG